MKKIKGTNKKKQLGVKHGAIGKGLQGVNQGGREFQGKGRKSYYDRREKKKKKKRRGELGGTKATRVMKMTEEISRAAPPGSGPSQKAKKGPGKSSLGNTGRLGRGPEKTRMKKEDKPPRGRMGVLEWGGDGAKVPYLYRT